MVSNECPKQQATGRLAMSLPTLSGVEKLQQALHTKAKESPQFRFYALYDKVFRGDVLWCALGRWPAARNAARGWPAVGRSNARRAWRRPRSCAGCAVCIR